VPRPSGPARSRSTWPLAAAIAVVLAAGALGAAGVGTGRDAEGAEGRAAGSGSSPATDVGQRALAVVFQPGDFPDGWEEGEREATPGPAPTAPPGSGATGQFCPALTGDPTTGQLSSEAESFFTNARPGAFSFAGSFVGVAADPGLAPAGFEFLAGDRFLQCAAAGFAKGFLESGTVDVSLSEVASEPLPVAPAGGRSEGRRLTFTARGPAFELPLYVDLAVVQAGASVGLAYLGAYKEPLPAALEQQLLDRLVERMAETG